MTMICPKQLSLLAVLILTIPACMRSNMNAGTIYQYADGSGNKYVLKPDTRQIAYRPVKPAQSSSGVYDGGDAATKIISSEKVTAIVKAIEDAAEKNSIHLNTRPMGSGTIVIERDGTSTRYVIDGGSPENERIEALLTDVMK